MFLEMKGQSKSFRPRSYAMKVKIAVKEHHKTTSEAFTHTCMVLVLNESNILEYVMSNL